MKIDVEKLAREAGILISGPLGGDILRAITHTDLERFARLVMEECARACQDTSVLSIPHTHNWTALKVQEALIEAIRARMP